MRALLILIFVLLGLGLTAQAEAQPLKLKGEVNYRSANNLNVFNYTSFGASRFDDLELFIKISKNTKITFHSQKRSLKSLRPGTHFVVTGNLLNRKLWTEMVPTLRALELKILKL